MFKKPLNTLLDLIYPPSCMICKNTIPIGKINSHIGICTNCTNKVYFNPRFITYKFNNLTFTTFVLLDYNDDIRNLIIDMKFNGCPENARYLGNIISAFLNGELENIIENTSNMEISDIKKIFSNIDAIIPSPMHKKKYKERGYNQSFLLAQEFSILTNSKIYNRAVIKTKNTQAQSTLTAEQRNYNLVDSLTLGTQKKFLLNKNILVIDDLSTTGNTLKEIILQLNNCNVSTIKTFALASTNKMLDI